MRSLARSLGDSPALQAVVGELKTADGILDLDEARPDRAATHRTAGLDGT